MSTELLTREGLGKIEILRDGLGWRTPEMWVNLRPLGISPGEAADSLWTLLASEMAEKCGVPVDCVSVESRQSWVDPRGRLVFCLTARKPPVKRIEGPPVIDV